MRAVFGAVLFGAVVGTIMGAVVNGDYAIAGALTGGYALGCLTMYATMQWVLEDERRREAENLERRKRYGR